MLERRKLSALLRQRVDQPEADVADDQCRYPGIDGMLGVYQRSARFKRCA